jgi:uncharacterized membrane protein
VSTLVSYAALFCVAGGLIAGAVALVVVHDPRLALRLALDMWLAAGLLRLALPPSWQSLLAAAAIVAIRQLVTRTLGGGAADGDEAPAPRG